ncbi:type III-A CRISPR-associated RAMP protein Csm5 [Thermosyntropha sp.]|uniref:type III-A CRISPR-associated RAMP protein Csm5 n=1 Tax=Thermosyntropha sp. TaxID=2740820 RepID=UPI0025E9AD94|nr:type III-A CRISPR-associated RAMP protein Csm5 [Thermosyntropha sp.]MBO8159674.1 type III-A CRISPR-associated RAMP protein Csm5 [Thermosyntropha sp.]
MPNKSYRMKLKVLTPLFIGGGNESNLSRTNYIFDEKASVVYILDEAKFIKFLFTKKLLDEYAHYVQTNSSDKKSNFNNLHLSKWLTRNGLKNFSLISSYQIKIEKDQDLNDLNDISCFIKNGLKKPYIPGSSIKGSLRSLIIGEFIKSQMTKDQNLKKYWDSLEYNFIDYFTDYVKYMKNQNKKKDKKIIKEKEKNINQQLSKMNNFINSQTPQIKFEKKVNNSLADAFRGIMISDSFPLKNEDLFITRSLRLSTYKKNGKHLKKLPLYIEYLKPGTEAEFLLTLNHDLLGKSGMKDPLTLINRAIQIQEQNIPALCGEKVFHPLAKEENINYFYSYDAEIKPNLVLGGQTGFNHKTLIYHISSNSLNITRSILEKSFPKHQHLVLDKKTSPRTLKLAFYEGKHYVTGMCRLELLEEVKI